MSLEEQLREIRNTVKELAIRLSNLKASKNGEPDNVYEVAATIFSCIEHRGEEDMAEIIRLLQKGFEMWQRGELDSQQTAQQNKIRLWE